MEQEERELKEAGVRSQITLEILKIGGGKSLRKGGHVLLSCVFVFVFF